MKPPIPLAVDGVRLGAAAGEFSRLIDLIHAADPLRPEADVLALALASFRKMHKAVAGSWVRQTRIELGHPSEPLLLVLPG